jgi:hypothetical protein
MTKQEFLDLWYLQYDEVNTFGAPGFNIQEITKMASKVQEDLIMLKYGPKSNRLLEGFEETEKRIQDLGELVTYKTYTTFGTGYFDNSYTIVTPNSLIDISPTNFTDVFWIPIYESVVTNTLNCTNTAYVKGKVEEAKHASLDLLVEDPFNKPYLKNDKCKVLRLKSANRTFALITDGTFTIREYRLGYIKKPTPIDFSTALTSQVSQLSEHIHRELLDETVKYALRIAREQQQFIIESQQSIPKE